MSDTSLAEVNQQLVPSYKQNKTVNSVELTKSITKYILILQSNHMYLCAGFLWLERSLNMISYPESDKPNYTRALIERRGESV